MGLRRAGRGDSDLTWPGRTALDSIRRAIDDAAKAVGAKSYRIDWKRNARGQLVIALIVSDDEGPLSKGNVP